MAALLPLLLAGCTDAPERPATTDEAQDVLEHFVDDATMIAGFTISETRITVTSGEPPATRQLHPEPDEDIDPVAEPAHPPWVRGSDFDLSGSVARAADSMAECGPGWAMVDVQVLTATAVATRTTCETDGQEVRSVMLNDETLEPLDEPISSQAVAAVWSEIEAAGLTGDVQLVALDRDADIARVWFSGPDARRTYEWNRGLTTPDSRVLSHPSPVTGELDLSVVSAELVSAALDKELAELGGPDAVERILVQPSDGGGAELLLTDADHTPLATVRLG